MCKAPIPLWVLDEQIKDSQIRIDALFVKLKGLPRDSEFAHQIIERIRGEQDLLDFLRRE